MTVACARLRKPAEFKAVFDAGRRLNSTHLTAIAAKGAAGSPRIGFALSKKVAPRAVDRNRIKRVARASFRAQKAHLPALDIVILGRGGCAKARNEELHGSLRDLWARMDR